MVRKGLIANIGSHGEPPIGLNYHAEMDFFAAGGLSNHEVGVELAIFAFLTIICRFSWQLQHLVRKPLAYFRLWDLFLLGNWQTFWSFLQKSTSSADRSAIKRWRFSSWPEVEGYGKQVPW